MNYDKKKIEYPEREISLADLYEMCGYIPQCDVLYYQRRHDSND